MKKYFICFSFLVLSSTAKASIWDIPARTTSTGGNVYLTQNVYGTAINYTVTGTQNIQNGGLAQNSTIYSGGAQNVEAGGRSENTHILYNGNQYIYGTSISSTVDRSGRIYVFSGGNAYNSIVNGGQISVSSGATSYNTQVNSGYQYIYGTDQNSTLNSGATQLIRSGGTAISTTINTNAKQQIESGAYANGSIVNGGSVTIDGTADDLTLNSGIVTSQSDGIINNSIVNGGSLSISGDANNITQNSGNLYGYSQSIIDNLSVNGGYTSIYGSVTDLALNSGEVYARSGSNFINPVINGGIFDITESEIDDLTVNNGNVYANEGTSINTLSIYGGNTTLYEGVSLTGDTIVDNGNLTLYATQNFSNLTLNNGTIISQDASNSSAISINNLSGNGKFYLTSNLTDDLSDHLQISKGSGTYGIALHDYSYGGSLPDKISIINTPDDDQNFYLIGGAVDIGAYQYNLLHENNEWILQRSFNNTESATIAKNTYSSLATIFYSHLQNLNTRLGEVRFNKSSGLWIRGFGNNSRIRHDDMTKTKINTVGSQFGYDQLIKQNIIYKWLVGIYGTISQSRDKFEFTGNGDINTYSTGLYSTMFSNNGYYLDIVGAYYYSRQDITSYTPAGMPVQGKYNLNAWSISAESGRRFRFDNGVFLEPQAQIQYMDLGDISYRTNFNTLVKGYDFNATLGRLGIMGGKEFTIKDIPIEVFLKISLLHDFDHKSKVSVADYIFTENNADTTWQFGAGFNAAINSKASSYFNISTTTSSDVSIPLNINLGLRVDF